MLLFLQLTFIIIRSEPLKVTRYVLSLTHQAFPVKGTNQNFHFSFLLTNAFYIGSLIPEFGKESRFKLLEMSLRGVLGSLAAS